LEESFGWPKGGTKGRGGQTIGGREFWEKAGILEGELEEGGSYLEGNGIGGFGLKGVKKKGKKLGSFKKGYEKRGLPEVSPKKIGVYKRRRSWNQVSLKQFWTRSSTLWRV